MTLYIPHSIFHLARLLYFRPENFGPYYVSPCGIMSQMKQKSKQISLIRAKCEQVDPRQTITFSLNATV